MTTDTLPCQPIGEKSPKGVSSAYYKKKPSFCKVDFAKYRKIHISLFNIFAICPTSVSIPIEVTNALPIPLVTTLVE